MHYTYRNINDAFAGMTTGLESGQISHTKKDSRNGPVLSIDQPVILTYKKPLERVLFNTVRDCNPFFHVYESMWMLAGRNDLAPLQYYVSSFKNYSDDGISLWGAYGYRWNKWFNLKQLDVIANMLFHDTNSRRCVLQMWDGHSDLKKASEGGKDVPCNLSVLFKVNKRASNYYLDMTVFNRSNDMIWGMLGANSVHMSFLQEFMAAKCGGLKVGKYHQISNDLHVYENNWKGDQYAKDNIVTMHSMDYTRMRNRTLVPLVESVPVFEEEISRFIDEPEGIYKEPFLNGVAVPLATAYRHHKERDYVKALEAIDYITAPDWQEAAKTWITKRRNNYQQGLNKV